MSFLLLNLIMLLLGFFTYFYFRSGVYAYCRISKMSKSYIRKNTKGTSNFWLYSQLHKQNNLGILYYLNLIYLFSLIIFTTISAFSWISFLKIPAMIVGILLGIEIIPVSFVSLIYTNIETIGKPFAVFRVIRGYNGKSRQFITIFDWLFPFIPLALYIVILIRQAI